MKVELKVTYDAERQHCEIVLPDSAILAAGMVELARAAVLHHKLAPMVVSKIQPATLLPSEVPRGQA